MTNQSIISLQTNSSYIKYRNWLRCFLILATVIFLILLFFGFYCRQENWSKATIINYDDRIHLVYFLKQNDYQKWVDGHYHYLECIDNNKKFYLKIDQTISKMQQAHFKNAIFVLISKEQKHNLSTKMTITVYTGSQPWLIYFFNNVV